MRRTEKKSLFSWRSYSLLEEGFYKERSKQSGTLESNE